MVLAFKSRQGDERKLRHVSAVNRELERIFVNFSFIFRRFSVEARKLRCLHLVSRVKVLSEV